MKQHYIDEKTGISYTLQGDYYLPDLVLLAEKKTGLSAYEDSGICGISNSIAKSSIRIRSQAVN